MFNKIDNENVLYIIATLKEVTQRSIYNRNEIELMWMDNGDRCVDNDDHKAIHITLLVRLI